MSECPNCNRVPKTLNKGDVVYVELDRDDGTSKLEGRARLEEYISTLDDPFPLTEKCRTCKRQLNVVKEKWAVYRVDDHFLTHVRIVRNIKRFHSHGIIPINPYNESDLYQDFKEFCTEVLENDPYLCNKLKGELFGNKNKTELYKEFKAYKNDIHSNE